MSESHTSELRDQVSETKFEAKRQSTILGGVMASVGALLAVGAFGALILLIVNGRTLDKWSAGIVAVFFVGGLALFGWGFHVMSRELVGAAAKDMAGSIRLVWRRNGP